VPAQPVRSTTPRPSEQHRSHSGPSPWRVLAVIGLAQLMVVLDSSIVNVALPSAQRALGFSTAERQWVVTAYSLAFASLLLLGGRLSDMVGRRRMFMIGLIGFAGASAVGGLSTDFTMLVAARSMQGAFAAMLAPAILSTLTTTFTDADDRRKAYGVYGAVSGSGSAVGLLLGGFLTQYLTWRWCLYVNVGLAVIALVGAVAWLEQRANATKAPRLDVPGVVLASAGLFSVVFGFSHAETAGWVNSLTLAFIFGGVVLLGVFAVHQARGSHPLLPLQIFASRTRNGSYLALLVAGAGLFGVFLFLTYYVQSTLGYSALKTGLAFLPMIALLVVGSTASSQYLTKRVGPRWIVLCGLFLAALGMVILAHIGVASGYETHILPGLVCIGGGIGLVYSSAPNQATSSLVARDAGVGSAMVTTMQQLGGSTGASLLNTLAASATATYLASRTSTAGVIVRATVHGYTTAFWWSAAIFAVGALLCGVLLTGQRPTVQSDRPVAA
jgi:EmrB/QacA subfamily drug resistance transporter